MERLCPTHKVRFNELLWCPLCLEDDQTFRDELAKEGEEDSEYFKKEEEQNDI